MHTSSWRLICTALCGVLLSACTHLNMAPEQTTPPNTALENFSLTGRFSLRHEDKNNTGKIFWTHRGSDNTVLLSSPFGQGIAEIVTDADEARLQLNDGRSYHAPNAEQLTQQILGYPLPLTQLADWVRARPYRLADLAQEEIQYDLKGRQSLLKTGDWFIRYNYADEDPLTPPNSVFVERIGGFELRLRIDEWHVYEK